MAFFKKKEKKTEEEKRKEEIQKIIKMTEVKLPGKEEFTALPTEYKEFLREIKQQPSSIYEKTCALTERIFPIRPSRGMEEKIGQALDQAFIIATPKGVLSLAVLITFILTVTSLVIMLLGGGFTFTLVLLIITFVTGFFLYTYPFNMANVMNLRMSSDTVLAILYMVIYMRTSPNLEGALRFTSENLKGPLSWDLKKLLWDIEVGKYASADIAFLYYIEKWKEKNKEFSESLHLLRSVSVNAERREEIFVESINVILNGTKERAKHYTSDLRMPMMLVDAMGVMLPVMGLVLFPVVMIFMADVVRPAMIAVGYNIIIPLSLFFLLNYIMQKRPPTFSQPDISKVKGLPAVGKFSLNGKFIPIWPIAVASAIPFLAIGLLGYFQKDVFASVNYSLLMIVGLAVGISVFCILDVIQKIKVRKDIEKIEDEFSVALFQLGNQIASGIPLEVAIDGAIQNLKNLKIADMFKQMSYNMRKLGYTFEQSLFDSEVGALRYYPSKLIESVMRTLVESSRKGVKFTSQSMITISSYLRDVHAVKEDIKDMLGETISSMKFLGMFLAPMVAGVTVTMAVLIIRVLSSLGGFSPPFSKKARLLLRKAFCSCHGQWAERQYRRRFSRWL